MGTRVRNGFSQGVEVRYAPADRRALVSREIPPVCASGVVSQLSDPVRRLERFPRDDIHGHDALLFAHAVSERGPRRPVRRGTGYRCRCRNRRRRSADSRRRRAVDGTRRWNAPRRSRDGNPQDRFHQIAVAGVSHENRASARPVRHARRVRRRGRARRRRPRDRRGKLAPPLSRRCGDGDRARRWRPRVRSTADIGLRRDDGR